MLIATEATNSWALVPVAANSVSTRARPNRAITRIRRLPISTRRDLSYTAFRRASNGRRAVSMDDEGHYAYRSRLPPARSLLLPGCRRRARPKALRAAPTRTRADGWEVATTSTLARFETK